MENTHRGRAAFVFAVDSAVDIITNSSSELFVIEGETPEMVREMIRAIYPGYAGEYDEPVTVDDVEDWLLSEWINTRYGKGFTMDGFREDEIFDLEWKNMGWMRVNDEFIKANRDKVIAKVDPERRMFFMVSKQDNPHWEYTERLESIGTRIHLG